MKIQAFLFLFLTCSEILYASEGLGKGMGHIFTWSFFAFSSFLGLFFVLYGLFSKSEKLKKSKIVGAPTILGSNREYSLDEMRNREVFGRKEEELYLEYTEQMEKYRAFETIVLYFFQGENLVPAYIKRSGILITPTENIQIENEEQVIEKLLKKEGVFNRDHTSLFLPLADERKLYGALEFCFQNPDSGLKISSVWADTKEFAKNFLKLHSYNSSKKDTATEVYNSEYFWDTIQSKSKEKTDENLTLISFFDYTDISIVAYLLKSQLVDWFGDDFKIYRLSDSIFSFFLRENENRKFQSKVEEILSDLQRYENRIYMSVGSADKNIKYSSYQKWFQRAENALQASVLQGQNHYKQFSLK
ncbi:MAG: hypothetical protein L6Q54_06755 [Leptospiraceae bacterium]|nr:hypothetical protein [Leptospiraceae bacterium]MCK6380937.1 hypothetical protein [Leptospiraceae bacterium]NUM40007.1 hypothetical protein [Leptospiraceae bacterium]